MDSENCNQCTLQNLQVLYDDGLNSKSKNNSCLIKTQMNNCHKKIFGCEEDRHIPKSKISFALKRNNKHVYEKLYNYYSVHKQQLDSLKFEDQFYALQSDINFKIIDEVEFVYIETMHELKDMLDNLQDCNNIAVNLRYHSLRSHSSFTWLMQISTGDTDYYIDTLTLQAELHILDKVFMNPKILKIFYKGKNSVYRLKKEFGLLVVNIFDVEVSKEFLMSSPLAIFQKELLKKIFYSSDQNHTHFLLYLKNYLSNLLLKFNNITIFKKIHKQCIKVCKGNYYEILWKENDIDQMLKMQNIKKLTRKEHYILEEICKWRDAVAKQEDEPPYYVMNAQEIFNLVKKCNQIKYLNNEEYALSICKIVQEASKLENPKQRIKLSHFFYNSINSKKYTSNYKLIEKINESNLETNIKPQLAFEDIIDNSSKIWRPRITEKPNAIIPLNLYIEKNEKKSRSCHPYATELQSFIIPHRQLDEYFLVARKSIEETPLFFIKTENQLMNVLKELKNYNEMAIDLKYNKKRSYLGYTCLIQISTRDSDYIIDALSLRSKLHILNEIFTKPTILKVFYLSSKKILWLQKDFSLYIINMFDVGRATVPLENQVYPLSKLIKKICGIKPKAISINDWRVRPLVTDTLNHLRNDTHYLLYVKDILSNQLFKKSNLLKRFYDYCTSLCKNTYQNPHFTRNDYLSLLNSKKKTLFNGQIIRINIVKELNKWRDEIAQKEDENSKYILSNKDIIKLAHAFPNVEDQIRKIDNSSIAKKYMLEIKKIICNATNLKIDFEKYDEKTYKSDESDVNESDDYESDMKVMTTITVQKKTKIKKIKNNDQYLDGSSGSEWLKNMILNTVRKLEF